MRGKSWMLVYPMLGTFIHHLKAMYEHDAAKAKMELTALYLKVRYIL